MIEAVFTNWRNAAPERFFPRFVCLCTGLSEDETKNSNIFKMYMGNGHGARTLKYGTMFVNRSEPSKSSG